jgi:DNA-directed RNA polymerase subunit N (RpoN/RPB10)
MCLLYELGGKLMKAKKKTNAARILDSMGIHYELKEYPVDIDDLSAVHVAASVGMNVKQVFKTLVARGDKNVVHRWALRRNTLSILMKVLAAMNGYRSVRADAVNRYCWRRMIWCRQWKQLWLSLSVEL